MFKKIDPFHFKVRVSSFISPIRTLFRSSFFALSYLPNRPYTCTIIVNY